MFIGACNVQFYISHTVRFKSRASSGRDDILKQNEALKPSGLLSMKRARRSNSSRFIASTHVINIVCVNRVRDLGVYTGPHWHTVTIVKGF